VASVTSSYFKYADAAILVFAYDGWESFAGLSQHLVEIVSNAEKAKIFLCGNKSDLVKETASTSCNLFFILFLWMFCCFSCFLLFCFFVYHLSKYQNLHLLKFLVLCIFYTKPLSIVFIFSNDF